MCFQLEVTARTLLPWVVVEAAMVVQTKAAMADRIEAEAAVDSVVGAEALTEAAEEVVVAEEAWGRCLNMGSVCGQSLAVW